MIFWHALVVGFQAQVAPTTGVDVQRVALDNVASVQLVTDETQVDNHEQLVVFAPPRIDAAHAV